MGKKSQITVAAVIAIVVAIYAFWSETEESCIKKAAATALTNPAFFALENLCEKRHSSGLTDAQVFGAKR